MCEFVWPMPTWVTPCKRQRTTNEGHLPTLCASAFGATSHRKQQHRLPSLSFKNVRNCNGITALLPLANLKFLGIALSTWLGQMSAFWHYNTINFAIIQCTSAVSQREFMHNEHSLVLLHTPCTCNWQPREQSFRGKIIWTVGSYHSLKRVFC